MLSKSQAKAFFLGFTVLFSGVFLALTVDTIRQVPARSHEDQLTPEVVAGKTLWDKNNCMGCHTILGEGAYYAPELTQVVARRGAPWMKVFLKDPEAMFPGRRKMIQYNFTDEQIDQLVAFFTWVGNIDTNGFPQKPDLGALVMSSASASTLSAASANVPPPPEYFTQVCQACHAVGGKGGAIGPALDGVASRLTADAMDQRLKDPASVKADTKMPNLHLTDENRAALVAWLTQLR